MSPTPPRRPARAPNAASREAKREAARRARQRRVLVVFGVPILAFVGLAIAHRAISHPARAAAQTTRVKQVPLSVGITRCDLVDTSRETPQWNSAGEPIAPLPTRRLTTEVRYPTIHPEKGASETANAAPARRRGPFPLVVFAHGYKTMPDTYAQLLDTWVRAGFVVAAPIFPDTNTTYVTSLGSIAAPEADVEENQPGDVAFVARTLLRDDGTRTAGCAVMHGLVDKRAGIGLAGQSDGATTVGMLAYDPANRSELAGLSVRAVALFSGAPALDVTYAPAPGAPRALVVQSATDQCNLPLESIDLYNEISGGSKDFLEILNATHLGPYTGSAAGPFALVSRLSTSLFKLTLEHSTSVAAFDAIGRSAPAVGRLTIGGQAPAIASPESDPAACYLN